MKIVAFGNPLLDTIVFLNDDTLLEKHKLSIDGQKEVSQDEIILIRKDIKDYEKTVTSGGCSQNTLKILQWLSEQQCSVVIFGAVGDDDEGKQLKSILENEGVETDYIIHKKFLTGSSIALVIRDKRSLVACLGAAEVISLDDVKNTNITSEIETSDLIYIEGFFLTKRVEAARFILNYCNSLNKVIAFNLCGEYLCREDPETVSYFVQKSSIIFGNRKEFTILCSIRKENTVESFARKLSREGRTVVITNGAKSVLCVNSDNCLDVKLPSLGNEIVDTTGAGDAFVSGFLFGYLLKKPLKVCVDWGCYAAQEIIKQKGCAVPTYSPTLDKNT